MTEEKENKSFWQNMAKILAQTFRKWHKKIRFAKVVAKEKYFLAQTLYALRCHGQLNALLPEAARPRAIVHFAVHGFEGHSFDYYTTHYIVSNDIFLTMSRGCID